MIECSDCGHVFEGECLYPMKVKCIKCRSLKTCHVPTEKEIERGCKFIQSTWTIAEELSRRQSGTRTPARLSLIHINKHHSTFVLDEQRF